MTYPDSVYDVLTNHFLKDAKHIVTFFICLQGLLLYVILTDSSGKSWQRLASASYYAF